MHMLDTVAKLTNSKPSSQQAAILSVDIMQQSVSAVKTLSSETKDYDPVTFLSAIDMEKVVNNMEMSAADLSEEVRSDKTINTYTSVSLSTLISPVTRTNQFLPLEAAVLARSL